MTSTPERTTTPKTKSPYGTPDRKVRARTELHEKLAEKDQQLQTAHEELQRATENNEKLMENDGRKQSVIDEQEKAL
eukprot:2467822-Karenia_brevis.AAC.1